MHVLITEDAERDIEEAFLFYNRQKEGLGEYFRDSIFSDIEIVDVRRDPYWIRNRLS